MADADRTRALKALAREQLSRAERTVAPVGALAKQLEDGEEVDELYDVHVDGKPALLGLTDRRVITVRGMYRTKRRDAAYDAIREVVATGPVSLSLKGNGIHIDLHFVRRQIDLIAAIERRRQDAELAAGEQDLTAQLQRLADLHASGKLSEEEFEQAKRRVLG